jgi:streptogramin lyase
MTTRLTIPFLLVTLLLSPLPTRQGTAFAQSTRAVKTYALPAGESPVTLLESGRRTWLVTQKSILELERNGFVRKLEVPAPIACAVMREQELWLGTDSGIVAVNPATYAKRRVALPAGEGYPAITTLFHTPDGSYANTP